MIYRTIESESKHQSHKRRPMGIRALSLSFCLSMLAFLIFTSSASATLFTLDSYGVTLNTYSVEPHIYKAQNDLGLMLYWDPVLSNQLASSWNLELGQQVQFQLFQVGTPEESVTNHDPETFPISVAFNFSSIGVTNGVVSGWSWGQQIDGDDKGHIHWGIVEPAPNSPLIPVPGDGPVYFHFGTSGILKVELTDVTFGTPDHDIYGIQANPDPETVWATLTYVSEDTPAVPEPGTIFLLGAGVVVLGVFRIFKKT